MVKLSVLVTFYNQEEYVDRAFEGIFRQKTDFPFEVIVGDDGSSDGTLDRVRAWQNKYPDRIRVIVQPREERKYLSGERAAGNRLSLLEHVSGEYFMYLDGDDAYCDDRKFQKQVDILDANRDCSCCAHNVSFIRLDGSSSMLKTWFKKAGKIRFSHYWWKGYFHPDSLMFRSENIRQDVDYRHHLFFNDNYITYVFGHQGKVYYLQDTMACYYETENGIWNGQSKMIGWLRTVTIYDYLRRLYGKNKISSYFRLVPLYYLVLKYRKEIKGEKCGKYLEIAEKNGAKLVSRLRYCGEWRMKLLKGSYAVLYAINAALKRVF